MIEFNNVSNNTKAKHPLTLTDTEFGAILADSTKQITGDIVWTDDEDHSPTCEFRCDVTSGNGWPLVLRGSYNQLSGNLTYVIILSGVGRIYALDIGKDHRNPDRTMVGEKHKHKWTEEHRDKEAYCPADITEPATDPVAVWGQFCAECGITHVGTMHAPSTVQLADFL